MIGSGLAPTLVAIGGNSELSFAKASSLRGMTEGPDGGDLGKILFASLGAGGLPSVTCRYFAWTGAPREDMEKVPISRQNWLGHERIVAALGPAPHGNPLVIVGWSNGGDTAYKTAALIGRRRQVDALITLDPVSRITAGDLPRTGDAIVKPAGVDRWFHAYTRHETARDRFRFGNVIAWVGGPWNEQSAADCNIQVPGNHGDTRKMLNEIVASKEYQQFLSATKA